MQDKVLSIDTTQNPPKAIIAQVSVDTISVIESQYFNFGDSSEQIDNQEEIQNDESKTINFDAMISDLSSRHSWNSSIVILPPDDHLTVHVELPFQEQKKIDQIIDMEVQDLVPFELEGFHVSATTLGKKGELFDTHVTIYPQQKIIDCLLKCKRSGIDPKVISSSTTVLVGLINIAPDFFAQSCALIWIDEHHSSMIVRLEGKVVLERSQVVRGSALEGARYNCLMLSKLAIISMEERYKSKISKVYLFAHNLSAFEAQQTLAREVEKLFPRDFVTSNIDSNLIGIAELGAALGSDKNSIGLLSNLRSGPFSYRPHLREFLSSGRKIYPYILATFVIAIVSMCSIYITRENRVAKIRDILQQKIKDIVPTANPQSGKEFDFLQAEVKNLEEELKGLGSFSKLTPLDLLLETSKIMPENTSSINFDIISIKDNEIIIRGLAPNYAAMDELEKGIKAKKGPFCSIAITDDASAIQAGGKVAFKITLNTCE